MKLIQKRIVSLLLVAGMCIFATACGNSQVKGNTNDTAESQVSEAALTSESEVIEAEAVETTETTETQTNVNASESMSKILVVYFSATGHTKSIAESIANGLSADIYEIVPEVPYTEVDLDYNDNSSRSTVEMNDPSVRPAISGTIENFDQYETVYIGFPIWWGQAPRILDTFVENYDFSDKTVIPFCTSASSGVGSSSTGLAEVAGTGNWLEGKRFSGNEAQDEVMDWVNGL